MFEMLTGVPPFQADNSIQIILKHLNDDPGDSFASYQALGISESLQNIVVRCLAKDVGERYQTADALERDLKGARVGQVIKRTPNKPVPDRKPLILGFGTVILFAFLLFLPSLNNRSSTAGDAQLSVRDRWSQLDRDGQRNFDQGNHAKAQEDFRNEIALVDGQNTYRSLVVAGP